MGVGLSKDGKPISDPSSAAPVGVAVTADSNVTAVTTAAENVLATVDEKATKAIVSLESVGGNVPNDSTLPEVVVAATKSESAPAVVVVKDVVPSSIADVAEKSHAKVDSKISLPAVEDIPNKVPEINVESSTPHVDSKVGTKPMTELLSPGNETKKSKSSPSIGSSFISLFRRNYSEREPETTTDAFKTSSAFHDVEVMPAKNASKTNASQSSAPADVAAAIDEKIAAVTAVTVNEPSASSTAVLALDTGIETKDEAEHNPIAAEEVILPTTVIAIDKDDVIAHVKDETKDVKNDSANVKNDTIADVKDEIIAPVTASVTAPVKDDVIAPLKDEVTSQPVAKGLLSRSKSSESANCCGGRGKDLAQAVYLPVASDQNKETVTDGIEIDGGGDTDEPKRMIIDHVDEGEEKSEKLLAVSALRPTATPGSASLAPILAPVLLVPALLAAHTVASTDAKKATLSNADTTAAAAAALPVTEKGINLTTSSVELPKTSLEVDPNTASNQAATASATESVDGSSLVSVEDEDEEADIDHDEKNDVCANFEIDHHQLTRISYKAKTDWWNAETESDSRCKVCWLRKYECFCEVLSARKSHYEGTDAIKNVKVCMYYHYQELGRSANTAHLYEAVCPSAKFEKVVFGDTEAEVKLVQDILTETMNEEPVTCVLYPSKDAILLSDWIKQRPASCKDKPIRLVALDGTYGQANRQWKYLTHALALLSSQSASTDTPSASNSTGTGAGAGASVNSNPEFSQVVNVDGVMSGTKTKIVQDVENKSKEESGKDDEKAVRKSVKLPVVKLDLEYGTCDSVLAGIMHQPGKDKICTYQALVMAMRQAGEDEKVCDSFAAELEGWISHILKRKIKFGKTKIRKTDEYSATPAAFVQKFLAENPPPTGPKSKKEEEKMNALMNDAILNSSVNDTWKRNSISLEKTKRFSMLKATI